MRNIETLLIKTETWASKVIKKMILETFEGEFYGRKYFLSELLQIKDALILVMLVSTDEEEQKYLQDFNELKKAIAEAIMRPVLLVVVIVFGISIFLL